MRTALTLTAALALTAAARPDEPKNADKLDGDWVITSAEVAKKKLDELTNASLTIKGDEMTIDNKQRKEMVKFVLDPAKTPKQITFVAKADEKVGGIYKLEGDTLTICFNKGQAAPPTAFETKEGTDITLLVCKRKK
jgi:uncharacterized protein (TIGR03067 family)